MAKSFIRKRIYREFSLRFAAKYPQVTGMSHVPKLVKKWWIMASVCNKKKQSKRNVLTEGKNEDQSWQIIKTYCRHLQG
jgi:hypothetical protein